MHALLTGWTPSKTLILSAHHDPETKDVDASETANGVPSQSPGSQALRAHPGSRPSASVNSEGVPSNRPNAHHNDKTRQRNTISRVDSICRMNDRNFLIVDLSRHCRSSVTTRTHGTSMSHHEWKSGHGFPTKRLRKSIAGSNGFPVRLSCFILVAIPRRNTRVFPTRPPKSSLTIH
jgi:hypothetical protein